jgi:hypothetical protein
MAHLYTFAVSELGNKLKEDSIDIGKYKRGRVRGKHGKGVKCKSLF